MKILDLRLRAFGPFTDRHLDLSGGQHGLHLIFGPNEAGKSSALRALRALLYGIPERTQDDFLHDKRELRVGGRLRGPDGEELLCFRRKGRKNTLLDDDGDSIEDERLARLLGGVDARLFERLFGIDHEGLVSGGQALLDERGREAEALFGSGLGGVDLPAVLKRLDQESGELFVPRGSTRLINTHLSQLAEIERGQREVSLSARHWDDARKTLNQARQRLDEMDEALAQASRQRNRLERIRRTLPDLAKRSSLLDQLAGLGDVPNLPDDFGRRREAAVSKRALAVAECAGAKTRLADLRGKAAALTVSEDLLAESESIDALRERLGSDRKAALDRPGLVADHAALEAGAAGLLCQIRPDLGLSDAPGLRPLLSRRRRVSELGGSREARAGTLDQASQTLAETLRKRATKTETLAGLPIAPSLEGPRQAIDGARRAGDLDRAIADVLLRMQAQGESCRRDLAVLGRWGGDLDALRHAPLPSTETIERFVDDFKDLEDEQRALDKTLAEAGAERQRIEETLRAFRLAGAVPSEDALGQARAHRDRGWALIKRAWLEGEDVLPGAETYGADAALPDAFESALAGADEVADRLRRETGRVHEQAAAQARLEVCDQRLRETGQAVATLAIRREALQGGWRSVWADLGVDPLPPREMLQWLSKASRLRERAGQGDELQAQAATLRETRRTQARALCAALDTLGLPMQALSEEQELTPLLNQAEVHLASLMETAGRRERLEREIAELRETETRLELEVTSRESDWATWSSDWARLMDELGLAGDASPGEASDHLKTLDDALRQIDEAQRLQSRIAGIDADAVEFRQQANALLGRLASDLLERPVEEGVPLLNARLGKQREDKSRRDELLMQSQRTEEDIQRLEADIQAVEAILGELCREAGRDGPEQLMAVEQRAQERRRLSEQLGEIETELVNAGDGLGIEALQQEAGSVDRDAVLVELTALEARIEGELRPRQASLLEEKVAAERDFTDMAGGDKAAALAEDAQHTLSSLRAHAERYVRVKLAARILRDEIERFRRRHRDPILTRASGYFAQLTCHAFSAVETDFDDSDQPVLVGLRATGERLRVEGMSTGTRDQLYLSLRLANLDHHLNGTDPLPFVVDDILIQFDDARARATLDALADFSAKTQVILFTHHQRVVEQACDLDPGGERVLVHALS